MKSNQNERETWDVSESTDASDLAPIPDAPAGLGEAPAKRRAANSDIRLRRMVAAALFAALAYLCVFVFRIKIGFLTFDFKDAVMTVGSFWLGPVAGVLTAAVVSLFEMISVSSTGPYGLLMNFVSSASFILPAAILFRVRRTRASAMIGLGFSVVVMVGVMLPMNLLITPLYQNVPRSVVADMIPGTLLPFNLVKGLMNAALTALLFQPVRQALHRVKILPPDEEPRRLPAWVIPVAAGVVAVASCLVCFLVLGGKFSLHR
ncbi:MAG: ECF transporter S component [Clostridia bacterium]|nr:ECF transporter S component [Clostridia bacterium]